MPRIGFGGGCHWCTEGIFASVVGVSHVQQGWIASDPPFEALSEAVIVWFDEDQITLRELIVVHLHSHSCTNMHHLRGKYRSAIYTFSHVQREQAHSHLLEAQIDFNEPIITAVLPFQAFKLNGTKYLNYYHSDPQKPFCKTNITPKLIHLMKHHGQVIDPDKVQHLSVLHPDQ